MEPEVEPYRYAAAKVVIVGDSGVGKSTLAARLAGQPYAATDSTHGSQLFELPSPPSQDGVVRQILLWDLPGQAEYRLVHQLHLDRASVAVLAFDAGSEEAAASIAYWRRVLREASGSVPMKVLLVAIRIDRGVAFAPEQIASWVERFRFDGYIATSSKTGEGVGELADRIRLAIDWSVVPTTVTTQSSRQVSEFLDYERDRGRLLITAGDLFREFTVSCGPKAASDRDVFETALRLAEHHGAIYRLNFGDFVLLQPYVLDKVATAIIRAARHDPYGLGAVNEDALRSGQALHLSEVPEDERPLLVLAAIEELLRRDIAFRDTGGEGSFLVFPSLAQQRLGEAPSGEDVVYSFEGNTAKVYATLVVRLARSGVFEKEALWTNVATFKSSGAGTSGVALRNINDDRVELSVFFTPDVEPHVRMLFQGFVAAHLHRMASSGSVNERHVVRCPTCGEIFTEQQVKRRLDLGHTTLTCPVCDSRVPIAGVAGATEQPSFDEMERNAAAARERDVAATRARGKKAAGEYDVFLSFSQGDRERVRQIARELQKRGLTPWFDEWELRPGAVWQTELEAKLDRIKAVALFIGAGKTPWEDVETRAFLRTFATRGVPIIPVVLPYVRTVPRLPLFAAGTKFIDCRSGGDPVAELNWALTGVRSGS